MRRVTRCTTSGTRPLPLPSPDGPTAGSTDLTYPSSATSSSRRNGSCQQTSGLSSRWGTPRSTAARCRAHPAPPGNSGRLRKMQASFTRRVVRSPYSDFDHAWAAGPLAPGPWRGTATARRQGGGGRLHPAGVFGAGEVRPVGAAALDQFRRRSGHHPLTTVPKMQVQRLSRKVTSNCHVRSSSGSGKLTHSWAPSGAACQDPWRSLRSRWSPGWLSRPRPFAHSRPRRPARSHPGPPRGIWARSARRSRTTLR